ncbi:MAG: type II secretion system F family protein [Clostridiales bacterium]|nr:type II secretion system F family protein [Clostridiales bacterium]
MAGYSYIAIDINGKEIKGKMEAPDEERVFHTLKAEGLYPVTIKELGILNKDINIKINNPVRLRDLSVFTRQFYTLLNAGIPIVLALDMLEKQTENRTLRKAIASTQIMVQKGEKLSDAMRNQGKIFPPILVNMVDAGEASGSLEVALERMAVHFEKEAKLRALIRKAMVYPASLCLISVGVIVLMITVVIPKFMDMFADMNMELPAITLTIMGISDFFLTKWYLILLIIVLIVIGWISFVSTFKGKIFIATLALKLPIIGKMNIKTNSARITRTLSTLITAGIPLIEAVDIAARTIDNLVIKKVLMESKEEIARGVPLSVPINSSGIFPPLVTHMMKIGEETGSMDDMLNKIADYYDEEVEAATQSLTAAIEPIIIIVLAVVVGGMIIAVMQPMFSMYEQFDRSILGGDPGAGIE